MNSTVICHFYNESYLLPFWLNHHKNIFDNGILINYNSTDDSVDIIKKIVPNWIIVNSKNENFEAHSVDIEVMNIEQAISGIKICLNVTEFLLCKNIKSLFNDSNSQAFAINRITMVQKLDFFKKVRHPLWNCRYYGYLEDNKINGLYRFVHTYNNGNYTLGRHSTFHNFQNTDKAIILWYGFSPFNIKILSRKLQIKSKIPLSDFKKNYGSQHNISLFKLIKLFISQHKHFNVINLKNIISKYI